MRLLLLISASPRSAYSKASPMPPPMGKVQRSLLSSSQSAVMIGVELRYQPLLKLSFIKYSKVKKFKSSTRRRISEMDELSYWN